MTFTQALPHLLEGKTLIKGYLEYFLNSEGDLIMYRDDSAYDLATFNKLDLTSTAWKIKEEF